MPITPKYEVTIALVAHFTGVASTPRQLTGNEDALIKNPPIIAAETAPNSAPKSGPRAKSDGGGNMFADGTKTKYKHLFVTK